MAVLSACDRGSLVEDEKPQYCADKPDGDACGTQRVCRAGFCVPVPPDRDARVDAEAPNADADSGALDAGIDAAWADAASDAPRDASGTDAARSDAEQCGTCQARECTNFYEVDLVAGCFTKIDPQFAADPTDTAFLSECSEAFQCALAAGCAFEDTTKGPMQCYCGSASLDDCPSAPAGDAACGAQWRRAARAKDPATAFGNMSNLEFPITWAYKLLDCLRERCGDVCRPVR